ncbi:uncharacterized protein LOC107851978 [Capsicum annuum]|uniref:uncharacterized protein LOC107851978 n=1 Tax=Capsicum annuum TaxID=4072 RepID=UPI001FB085F4|nr:uncharacterized protein LOC107851978 [Capsicum annuum]
MAKAYRKEDFDYIMTKVGKVDPRVKEYLEEAGYEKWKYIIDIDRGTCNCGQYQIDEIPCAHVIVILKSKNIDVKEYGCYCSELYRPNTIVKTYELPIVTMLDMKDWNIPQFVDDEEVLPPKYKRPLGRPKKRRHLKSSESLTASSNHCDKCKHAGHNRRKCDYFSKES